MINKERHIFAIINYNNLKLSCAVNDTLHRQVFPKKTSNQVDFMFCRLSLSTRTKLLGLNARSKGAAYQFKSPGSPIESDTCMTTLCH